MSDTKDAALPHNPSRLGKLSPDKPAVMPPGWKFPSPEQVDHDTLGRLFGGDYRKRADD